MNIEWIGQSGYILRTAEATLVLDPYLSDAVNRVAGRPRLFSAPIEPEAIRANAVVCTHDHLDHLDPDAIVRMDADLHFLTTCEGRKKLRSLGRENVTALHVGDTIAVGNMTVTAVYARHTVEAFGVVVRGDGVTLYFSGDTLFDKRLYGVAQFAPDVTFLCINGKLGNMNVSEAVEVARSIGAPVNVPNHYGMFASNTEDPAKFTCCVPGGTALESSTRYQVEKNSGAVRLYKA
jgi:hypothetical protein